MDSKPIMGLELPERLVEHRRSNVTPGRKPNTGLKHVDATVIMTDHYITSSSKLGTGLKCVLLGLLAIEMRGYNE